MSSVGNLIAFCWASVSLHDCRAQNSQQIWRSLTSIPEVTRHKIPPLLLDRDWHVSSPLVLLSCLRCWHADHPPLFAFFSCFSRVVMHGCLHCWLSTNFCKTKCLIGRHWITRALICFGLSLQTVNTDSFVTEAYDAQNKGWNKHRWSFQRASWYTD